MRILMVMPVLGFMSFSAAAFVPQEVDTSRRGMVYGHLAATPHVERVELAAVGSVRRPQAAVLANGDFYFPDIAPGQYVLTRFEVDGEWFDIASDRGVREFMVAVEPGSISFAGAWQVTGERNEAPRPAAFGLLVAEKPGSDQILRRLRYSLRGTGWEKQIP